MLNVLKIAKDKKIEKIEDVLSGNCFITYDKHDHFRLLKEIIRDLNNKLVSEN